MVLNLVKHICFRLTSGIWAVVKEKNLKNFMRKLSIELYVEGICLIKTQISEGGGMFWKYMEN